MDLNRDHEALLALLDQEKPAYVVNFAAQSEVAPSWEHPEQWFETNAVAIARLGNFLKDKEWLRRYVHISTPEVYGTCDHPVAEDEPFQPSTPYAASRAAGELMLQTLVKSFDFPLVVIRSSNVYGAHQQLWKIIPRTAIYVRQGRKLQLHGGGRQVRSFIHIRDVSRGELAAMEHGRNGEAYNLAPERGWSCATSSRWCASGRCGLRQRRRGDRDTYRSRRRLRARRVEGAERARLGARGQARGRRGRGRRMDRARMERDRARAARVRPQAITKKPIARLAPRRVT
jgi:UDP-glucose 4-epimerase